MGRVGTTRKSKRALVRELGIAHATTEELRTASLRSKESYEERIRELYSRLREASRQLEDKDNYVAQIENLAITPPEALRLKLETNGVVLLSVDGVNASGKGTLLKTLDYALTACDVRCVDLKESRDLDPLAEERRSESKRIGERVQRELVIGYYVTLGRLASFPELTRRLNEGSGLVILDRYYPSTLAYQTGVAELDMRTAIARIGKSYLLPHRSVLLLCDPRVARLRETERRTTEDERRSSDSLDDLEMRAKGFCGIASHIPRGYVIDTTSKRSEDTAIEIVEQVISPYLVGEGLTGRVIDKIREKYRTNGNGH